MFPKEKTKGLAITKTGEKKCVLREGVQFWSGLECISMNLGDKLNGRTDENHFICKKVNINNHSSNSSNGL